MNNNSLAIGGNNKITILDITDPSKPRIKETFKVPILVNKMLLLKDKTMLIGSKEEQVSYTDEIAFC